MLQVISGNDCFHALDNKEYFFFYFGASWCNPCNQIAPKIMELSKKYDPNMIKFYKIDLDDEANKEVIQKCEIKVIPAFLIFKDRTFLGRGKGGDINIPMKMIQEIVFPQPKEEKPVEEEVEEGKEEKQVVPNNDAFRSIFNKENLNK